MAVVVLSGLTTSLASLRFAANDGSSRKCLCGGGKGLSSSSSSTMASTSILEVGTLARNCPTSLSVGEGAVFPAFRSQSGAVFWREGTSSRRKSHGRGDGAILTGGMCWTELKVSRFKACATKDKSLQTDSRDSQSLEETPRPSSEAADDPAVPGRSGEPGAHVHTDAEASTSEGTDLLASDDKQDGEFGGNAKIGLVVTGLGTVLLFGGLGAGGYVYKDQINDLVNQFTVFIEGYGSAGYGIFILGYALLELVAIPAIPLTMSAGLLFGVGLGTLVVSLAGLLAATVAFLIARYLARNRLLEYIKGNKKFMAIDKAIGEDGLRVVALLRLSPLLPFSLGNYLYGLTSVELLPYVIGSWLGMLPGTWAYVSAGAIGRSLIVEQENENIFSGGPEHLWTLGLGLAVTALAATYITRVAKEAVSDIEEE